MQAVLRGTQIGLRGGHRLQGIVEDGQRVLRTERGVDIDLIDRGIDRGIRAGCVLLLRFGRSVRLIGAERGRLHIGERDHHILTNLRAGLDVDRATLQQIDVVELRVGRDVADLADQGGHFLLQVDAIVIAQRSVGRLHGQFPHTLQHVRDLVHAAFGGLRQGDAVIGVADRHGKAAHFRSHLGGDGEACCVVAGGVDALAGRQAFHRLAEAHFSAVRSSGGAHCGDVGSDDGHDKFLYVVPRPVCLFAGSKWVTVRFRGH